MPLFCSDYGSVKIFSTSNIMMMDGSYVYPAPNLKVLSYSWTLYKQESNTTHAYWTALTASELANLDGKIKLPIV